MLPVVFFREKQWWWLYHSDKNYMKVFSRRFINESLNTDLLMNVCKIYHNQNDILENVIFLFVLFFENRKYKTFLKKFLPLTAPLFTFTPVILMALRHKPSIEANETAL